MARWVAGGVELKCRRCKRTLVVPVTGDPAELAARAPDPYPVRKTG